MSLNLDDISTSSNENKRKEGTGIMDFLNKDISFSKSISDKKKLEFFSELSILLSSGVDLRSSLDIIVSEQTKDKDRELYQQICNTVIDGENFSTALKKTDKFSLYEYYTVQIGEESGNLAPVLKELSIYFDKKQALRRKVVNAVSYPAIVLSMTLLAMIFMMNFLVPMFVDIFKRFDAELPALTQTIISISNFFGSYGLTTLLLLIMVIVFIYAIRQNAKVQKLFSVLLIKMPFIGSYVRLVFLQRFFQAMSMLTSAHTPVVTALNMVKKMVNLSIAKEELGEIEQKIISGMLLNEAMNGSILFTSRIQALVKVGEEVNQLGNIFSNLNDQLRQQLDYKVSMLSNVMEPFLIIFVGGLVAVILIAMYLPMFQMSTAIH